MRLGLRTTLQKARRDLSKLTRKVIVDKNGHKKTVYVRLGVPIKWNGSNGRNEKVEEGGTNPVQHEGEFVLTSEGSKDFGEISVEIAQAIRRQAGKIRLRIGEQEGKPGDYGEKHIERIERMKELISNGYNNARDFVHDVASGYNAIYSDGGGRLTLYKKADKKGISLFIELIPAADGDFYDVKTGMVTRDTYYKNKKPLWDASQNG